MSDLAREIETQRFTTTRFRPGYDPDEVDDFLDRVIQAVRNGDDLTPMIDAARFRSVTLGEAYDEDEVDDYLEGLKHRQQAESTPPATAPASAPSAPATSQPSAPPAARRPDSSTVPEPTLPANTGSLRRWLFGRR